MGFPKSRNYRLAPLVVGFWEEEFESVDEELAKFWLEYLDEALVIKVMAAQPPLEPVVPAQSAISKEYILPYDELIPLIEDATHFELRECICRKSKRLAGQNNCDFPLEVCLTALKANLPNRPHTITKVILRIRNNSRIVKLFCSYRLELCSWYVFYL